MRRRISHPWLLGTRGYDKYRFLALSGVSGKGLISPQTFSIDVSFAQRGNEPDWPRGSIRSHTHLFP